MRRTSRWMFAAALLGCGYTEQEWQAQLDKTSRLEADRRGQEQRVLESASALNAEKAKVTQLEQRLVGLGFEVGQSGDIKGPDRERALVEFRARAKSLEAMKARADYLKGKLGQANIPGVELRVHRNRLVVTVSNDKLFDAGKDKLTKGGKDALTKIADILKGDVGTLSRDFQATSHTDPKPPTGGAFGDNLTLSAMRARAVALFMTDAKGGGLPRERWSAAGFGEMDPVVLGDSDISRKTNQRTEIVLLPNQAELLDLSVLAGSTVAVPAPSATPTGSVVPPATAPPTVTAPPKASPPPAPPASSGAPKKPAVAPTSAPTAAKQPPLTPSSKASVPEMLPKPKPLPPPPPSPKLK